MKLIGSIRGFLYPIKAEFLAPRFINFDGFKVKIRFSLIPYWMRNYLLEHVEDYELGERRLVKKYLREGLYQNWKNMRKRCRFLTKNPSTSTRRTHLIFFLLPTRWAKGTESGSGYSIRKQNRTM